MEQYLLQAQALLAEPAARELVAAVRTLSSISAMFWMLARLADLLMAGVKELLFEELAPPLNFAYLSALAVIYAGMMFFTAFNGGWHPSLLWREICGFAFMYIMLGVTFTERRTGRLKPQAPAAFFFGVVAYLALVRAPGLVRLPALANIHRVLELFAAGGWGNVMTAITVVVAAWSLAYRAVSEFWFGVSPLLYKLKLLKALPVRFDMNSEGGAVVPSLARSWFILTLLAGGVAIGVYWWPRLRAAGEAAVPALQSRAQSPEAAAAAAKLGRVLPAVSFSAIMNMPVKGTVADIALPVFRKLLDAPREADRWLAAAALDRLDPSYYAYPPKLFSSTETLVKLPCTWGAHEFKLLVLPLPGDDPAKTRLYWLLDGDGLHYSGIGPGEVAEIAGSSGCAAAAFGRTDGPVLLAFTEAPQAPGQPHRLWLSAYDPKARAVAAASAVAASTTSDFALAAMPGGAAFADTPSGSAAAPCKADCGSVMGTKTVSLTTEPLVEYRGAAVEGGAIKVQALPDRTYAASGLRANYPTQADFNAAFRYDHEAGFLNRWYRLAVLADGRRCVTVALDPTLPGTQAEAAWNCER